MLYNTDILPSFFSEYDNKQFIEKIKLIFIYENIQNKPGYEIIRFHIIESRLRWCFKRILNAWLYKRILSKRIQCIDNINLESITKLPIDPITLEEIINPIELIDLNNRKIFYFDAKTLTRYLHSQLLKHGYSSSFHTHTHEIKNPYTLIPFTFKDFCGIYTKIKIKTWAIESFYESGFSIELWKKLNEKMIKIKKLNSDIIDKTETFQIDFLSFIAINLERLKYAYIDSIINIIKYSLKKDSFCKHIFIQNLIQAYRLYNQSIITDTPIEELSVILLKNTIQETKILDFINYITVICKDHAM